MRPTHCAVCLLAVLLVPTGCGGGSRAPAEGSRRERTVNVVLGQRPSE